MKVSVHDHVGHMVYEPAGDCACRECGQRWEMVVLDVRRRYLRAVPYEGSWPADDARGPRP